MVETEFKIRRSALAGDLAPRRLDALIVSGAPNIRYLSGFTGSNAMLLVGRETAVLFTDPRYGIQARRQTGCRVKLTRGPLAAALVEHARRRNWRRLAFESRRVSFEAYQSLKEGLPLGATLVATDGLIEERRMIKSAAEIAAIRRSVEINSLAFERALKRLRPRMTELDLAAELDHQMRRLGAEGPAFDTIVASGARSAQPHAEPTINRLPANGLLLVDMGARQAGYASDMTRTLWLGRASKKVKSLYQTVLEAQLAALAAIRDGAQAGEVDRAARRRLRAADLAKAFVHSTGHGLGLEIHEPPRLGKLEKTVLRAGMVVTAEPGVYLEGLGGIRIEDTVLVTGSGCEVLTPTSKELLVL